MPVRPRMEQSSAGGRGSAGEDDFRILEQRRLRVPAPLQASTEAHLAGLLRAERERSRALEVALAQAQAEVVQLTAEKKALSDYYDQVLARVQEMGELERRSAEIELDKVRKSQQLRVLQESLSRVRQSGSERGSTRTVLRGQESAQPSRNSSLSRVLSLPEGGGSAGTRVLPRGAVSIRPFTTRENEYDYAP